MPASFASPSQHDDDADLPTEDTLLWASGLLLEAEEENAEDIGMDRSRASLTSAEASGAEQDGADGASAPSLAAAASQTPFLHVRARRPPEARQWPCR
jgi:hypothetical protein